jgi:hypothetical protein
LGRPSGADVLSPYLLSGIAACSLCHGSLVAISRGEGKAPRYGCLHYHRKGTVGCLNGLQIRQDCLESRYSTRWRRR